MLAALGAFIEAALIGHSPWLPLTPARCKSKESRP